MNHAVQLIGQHPALQDKRRNYAAVLGCDSRGFEGFSRTQNIKAFRVGGVNLYRCTMRCALGLRTLRIFFAHGAMPSFCKRGKDHDKDPSIEFVGRSGGFCCS